MAGSWTWPESCDPATTWGSTTTSPPSGGRPAGRSRCWHWIAAARARLIPPAPRPGALLVDLACGGGLMAPHVARLGYRHIGVDLTTSALRLAARPWGARRTGRRARRCRSRDGCADVVAAGEILEHVHDPHAVVAEAAACCGPAAARARHDRRDLAGPAARGDDRRAGARPAPRGIHDPALFVDRDELVRRLREHGVPLTCRGSAWTFRSARRAGGSAQRQCPACVRDPRPPRCSSRAGAARRDASTVPASGPHDHHRFGERVAGSSRPLPRSHRSWPRAPPTTTATAAFPVAGLRRPARRGLFGLMVPTAARRRGAGFADYAEVAIELAPGQRRDGAGLQHARLGHRRAGRHPRRAGPRAGRTRVVLRSPRPAPRRRRPGALLRGRDERARRRLPAVPAHHAYEPVDGGFHIKGAKTFCSGAGHADGYLVAARRTSRRPVGVAVPGARPAPGLRVEPTWDSLGMRATGSHDLHLDVSVAGRRAARRGRGAGPAGRPGHAALAGRQLRRRLRRGRAGRVDAARRRTCRRAGSATCRRSGPGSAGPTRRWPPPGWSCWRRPARVDTAPGDAETNRWVWRAKLLAGQAAMDVAASCWRRPARRPPGAGHPLERLYRDARCGSLQPATSRRLRRLARRRRAGPRPRRRHGTAMVSAAAHRRVRATRSAGAARRTSCGTASSRGTTPATGLAHRIFAAAGCRHPARASSTRWWRTSRRGRPGSGWRGTSGEALPLGKEAVSAALADAGLAAADVGPVRGLSCTGYVTPGLDILLARDLGMAAGRCSGCSSGTWAATRRCRGSGRRATSSRTGAGRRCCSAWS